MKKITGIVFFNIILSVFLILSVEIIIWGCENLRVKYTNEIPVNKWPLPFHPGIKRTRVINIDWFNNVDFFWTRKPEGLYYTKKPVVVFGCSYAFGFTLKNEQTFSYKLSHLTRRPVYNRAMAGWGIQHMLNQVRQSGFYKDVPEPEYVIFVMINDHFRRLYAPTFMSANLVTEDFNLRYENKNGELVLKQEKNKFFENVHRSYFLQKIEHFYINNILLEKNNHKKYFDFAAKHFIASKSAMQKHWKNAKYVIILYQAFWYDEIFIKQLKDNGFIVISLPNDYGLLNLRTPEYQLPNYHPTEKAWNLITPKIIGTLNL